MPKAYFSRMSRISVVVALGALASCGPIPEVVSDTPRAPEVTQPASRTAVTTVSRPVSTPIGSPQEAARVFAGVLRQMEPAVERECLARRTRPINCDFQFVVDDRLGQEPNAFQTEDAQGRPVIGFNLALIGAARNADELAFVVGHEASHHILNHLSQKATTSTVGGILAGGIAAAAGADPTLVRAAQQVGSGIGARTYSRDWELQADYLGAIMTRNAGYDPIVGADFFRRMPDPGHRILGTHPSNAQRIAQVQRAVADLEAGKVR